MTDAKPNATELRIYYARYVTMAPMDDADTSVMLLADVAALRERHAEEIAAKEARIAELEATVKTQHDLMISASRAHQSDRAALTPLAEIGRLAVMSKRLANNNEWDESAGVDVTVWDAIEAQIIAEDNATLTAAIAAKWKPE